MAALQLNIPEQTSRRGKEDFRRPAGSIETSTLLKYSTSVKA
jgi:hypothetical protein